MKWAAYALRLPPDLKADLERKAAANERSLNREIVARLKASLIAYSR
jgi:hypothetical protein